MALLTERGLLAPEYTEEQLDGSLNRPQCDGECKVSGIVNTGLALVDRTNPLLWGYTSSRKVEWVSWVAPTYDHKEQRWMQYMPPIGIHVSQSQGSPIFVGEEVLFFVVHENYWPILECRRGVIIQAEDQRDHNMVQANPDFNVAYTVEDSDGAGFFYDLTTGDILQVQDNVIENRFRRRSSACPGKSKDEWHEYDVEEVEDWHTAENRAKRDVSHLEYMKITKDMINTIFIEFTATSPWASQPGSSRSVCLQYRTEFGDLETLGPRQKMPDTYEKLQDLAKHKFQLEYRPQALAYSTGEPLTAQEFAEMPSGQTLVFTEVSRLKVTLKRKAGGGGGGGGGSDNEEQGSSGEKKTPGRFRCR